jgi:nitroreductase
MNGSRESFRPFPNNQRRRRTVEYSELIERRFSVRRFRSDAVEDEKLERILNAARMAPSAANRQPYQFLVVHTEGRRNEFEHIYNRDWFLDAPVVIFACGLIDEAWHRDDGKSYIDVDVSIAMDHLILAAANEGLGTCWIGSYDEEAVRAILGIPDRVRIVAITPLGYPAMIAEPKERKPLDELVRYEAW